jgi:peptidoglycan hydrolase-like protein with peptidoglycan-binding domain
MPRIDVATVTLGWLGRAAPVLVAVLLLLLLLPTASVAAGGSTGSQANEGRSSGELLSVGTGYGDQGGAEGVRKLQVRLRGAGYEPGPIDGLFGPLTRAAVQGFQRAHGLATDGVVGPQTAAALRRATPQAGVQPVRLIQRQLHALGYKPGPLDGVYGPLTAAAVERFQRAEGLAVNGVPGSQTAARLEAARAALVREPAKVREPANVPEPAKIREPAQVREPVRRPAGPSPADTTRSALDAPSEPPGPSTSSVAESSSSADPSSPLLRPGYLALLAAFALALVLTGVRARRRERTPAPAPKPVATSRVGARFNPGVACALLLGGLVVGAAAGALFATQASPDDGAAATANSLLSRAGQLGRPAASRAERPERRSERPERRPVAKARAASAPPAAPAKTKAPSSTPGRASAAPAAPVQEKPAGVGEAVAALPSRPAERPARSAPDRGALVADIVRPPAGRAPAVEAEDKSSGGTSAPSAAWIR